MMPRMSPRQTIPTTSMGVRRSMISPLFYGTLPNPTCPDADTLPDRTCPVTAGIRRSHGIDIVTGIGTYRVMNGWAAQYVVFFCAFHSIPCGNTKYHSVMFDVSVQRYKLGSNLAALLCTWRAITRRTSESMIDFSASESCSR